MIKVTTAILAYNAEKNIEESINALLRQSEYGFEHHELIIHSDASTDNTVKIVNNITDSRIKVIDNRNRKGFGRSLETVLKASSGDIVIIFNDDIRITDVNLLRKLNEPFKLEDKIGLVCGHPYPLDSKNFIENAITSTYLAYDEMRNNMENIHNKFTCDGKILAFSRQFIDALKMPSEDKMMGNTDSYLYFYCITNGFLYRYCSNAIVYYRNPTTIQDYVKWTSRNNSNKKILSKQFGGIVEREYKKPKSFLIYSLKESIKNPFGALFIFFMRFYIKIGSWRFGKNFNPTWDTVTTTKNL